MSAGGARSLPRASLLCGLALLAGAAAGSAQTPAVGRPDLYRVRDGALILEAPPSLRAQADRLARDAQGVLSSLEGDLGVRAVAPFRIVLIPPGHDLTPELARLDAAAPSWASGFMIGYYRVGAIRLGQVNHYPYDGALEVLAHEAAHLLLWDATRGALPTWFSEGVATLEGRRRGVRDFFEASAAVLSHSLPAIADLDAEFEASPSRARRAYAVSLAFVSWSEQRYGPNLVPQLLDQVPERGFAGAWKHVTGDSLGESEERWRGRMLWFHRWAPVLVSSSTLWLGISLLAILAGLVKRRRRRRLHALWEEEERLAAAVPLALPSSEPDETIH